MSWFESKKKKKRWTVFLGVLRLVYNIQQCGDGFFSLGLGEGALVFRNGNFVWGSLGFLKLIQIPV